MQTETTTWTAGQAGTFKADTIDGRYTLHTSPIELIDMMTGRLTPSRDVSWCVCAGRVTLRSGTAKSQPAARAAAEAAVAAIAPEPRP